MARWTVQDGEHLMVIDASDGNVEIDVPSGLPFITGAEGVRDMRRKLGLAIGEAEAEPPSTL